MKPIYTIAIAAGLTGSALVGLSLTEKDTATAAEPVVAQAAPTTGEQDAPIQQAQLATDADMPDTTRQVEAKPLPDRAGPYLAARYAATRNDYAPAAKYFEEALQHDPKDVFLQDGTLLSLVQAGDVAKAVEHARKALDSGATTELAGLIARIDTAKQGDWDGVLAMLDSLPSTESGGGPLMDGITRAWALMGAGKASEAFAALEKLEGERGASGMARFQLALAKASVGDYEAAATELEDPETSGHFQGLVARVQVLSQLERNADAIKVLDELSGLEAEPTLLALRKRLEAGETLPFDVIKSPADGLAQVMVTFAGALMGGEDTDPLALLYARLAQYLSPDMPDAQLLSAQLLQSAGQFDLAEKEYEGLRTKGDMRPSAELARIDALARADREPDAEAAARKLVEAWPDLPSSWVSLGDLLRQQDKFAESLPAYDKALELLKDNPDPQSRWFPLYARGISYERTGQFDKADADFQAALELQPEQAPILNYLGYSWVDRNIKLDEGLELIRKAVELRPDDGYILDSLAWAYYRLGRYEEAVEPMEKAVTSMSGDSLVNDHMGDVYWMVGRKREAEIQWKRAQSFYKPEDTDTDINRINAKLEVGLDEVLKAEAANGGKLPDGFGQPEPQPEAPAETAAGGSDEPVPPQP